MEQELKIKNVKMNEFITIPLLITEYYHSLISQLDIYTEETIKRYKWKGLPKKTRVMLSDCGKSSFGKLFFEKYGVDTLNNPYEKEKYKIERTKIPKIEITYISQAEEYMNKVRQKAIDEIRMVQDENLKFYNENKEKFKIDRKNLTEEKLEELKCQLFANRFCFLVKIEPINTCNYRDEDISMPLFNLRLVITDFYLRELEIDYIRNEIDNEYEINHPSTKLEKVSKLDKFFERFLLPNQVRKYIQNTIDIDLNGYEIIHIKQNTLFEIDNIEVVVYNGRDLSFKETDLSFDTDIDLSAIKSLNLYVDAKINDLSAFVNLEYLFIYRIKLCQSPFQNLQKLIKIKTYNCDLSEFDFDSLNSLNSLQIIDIDLVSYRNEKNIQSVTFKFDLNRLINLKWLDMKFIREHEVNNLELITDDSYNQLTYIRVNKTRIDFSNKLDLPELKYLDISNVDLSQQINQQVFNGMSYLIELNLNDTTLINVDFLNNDRLGNLEKLNLSCNQIQVLRKGAFSKLKQLKMLNLDKNQIKELITGVFEGLECLEHLNISSNLLDSTPIDKTIFCMFSLNELNLSKTNLTNVDFLDNDRLGNLKLLNLSHNKITVLRKEAFFELKKLNKLDLSYNQIKELIPGVFEGLECLEHLNITSNNINIGSLDKSVFDELKCLKDLYIRDYESSNVNVDNLKRDGLNVY